MRTTTLNELGKVLFLGTLRRLERTLAFPSVSAIYRWLGQSAMLGLVPQLLDGLGPGGAKPAN